MFPTGTAENRKMNAMPSNKTIKKRKKQELAFEYLIPSVLMAGWVPLIMRFNLYSSHLTGYDWFPDSDKQLDTFLRYKQWAVVVLACICILILIIRKYYYYRTLSKEKFMIPAGIFGIFVLLSAIFGKHPLLAFAGGNIIFQSALAWLGFLVICYYTYDTIISMDHLLWFLRWSEWFILAELLIATFQGFGMDLLRTQVGKLLYYPVAHWGDWDMLHVRATDTEAYGTLFNVDYVSMYLAVLVPIFIGLIIVEKKLWRKLLNAGLCALSLFVGLHGAASWLIGIGGALAVGAFVLCSRRRKSMLICCAAAAALFLGGLAAINKVPVLKEKTVAFLGLAGEDDYVPVEKVYTGKTGIEYTMKDGRKFKVSYDLSDNDKKLTPEVKTEDGQVLTPVLQDEATQTYVFSEEGWSDLAVRVTTKSYTHSVDIIAANGVLTYTKDDKKGYLYINPVQKKIKLPTNEPVEVAHVFPDRLFTGRGRIYNKSLPLLRHTLFIGAGANNFIIIYPQWDYIGKTYLGQDFNTYDTKPHSLYLQTWIEEGFIAFAALMVFFFWYLVDSIRLYRKTLWMDYYDKTKPEEDRKKAVALSVVGFAIFIGVVGYLIVGLANDSTICTAPVCWTLLGAGWAVNKLTKANAKTLAK